MRRTLARIESLVLSPLGWPGVRLQVPPAAIPAPGQAVLGCRPDADDPLRHVLLPFVLHENGFSALNPEGAAWQPGERIDLVGPVGRGFHPPGARRRWLLAAFGASPEVLLPVLHMGVDRGVGLAMYADSPVPTLPPQVEVSPDLDSALDWADYACLAVTPEWLEHSELVAPGLLTARAARRAEILVVLPMPCGTGVCGACAVGRGRAARHACTEGPVFALEDLVR